MSDKQRLQVNNTNLSDIFAKIGDLPLKALVEAAAREGQYVWKKFTAEGGTLLDYVVNDSEIAYPDGDMQDGFWYERVSEGIPLPDAFTSYAIDKITFSSASPNNTAFYHTLGTEPKVALLSTKGAKSNYGISRAVLLNAPIPGNSSYKRQGAIVYVASTSKESTSDILSSHSEATDTYVKFENSSTIGSSSTRYEAGAEYTLITMA